MLAAVSEEPIYADPYTRIAWWENRVEELEADLAGYRRALLAHHDLATLSDDVIREYDWRECPVCARARKQ